MIAEETVLEVKRAADVLEVVTSYFPLRRRGTNLWAACPFHEEKTPSFSVNPEKQIFKCFGCGEAGDAISFVMKYLKVDYPEAIRTLAERLGVTVKYTGRGEEGPSREELERTVQWASKIFRSTLQKAPEAEAARQFLVRRGVSEETAELFSIGWAPDSWDHLLGRARRSEISEDLLVAAGLAKRREGKSGCYDFFRGRVMFPIGDASGRTVAFGARTLGDEQPKFLNSPDSRIFSKGRGFYGLHHAKEEWEKTRTAYVVEGYLDVVVPHQAGVRGLVATLGTSMTKDHLRILRRYVDKVVLVFDPDDAGQRAADRGVDMLLSEKMDAFVAALPKDMDPDDVVLKQSPDALRAVLGSPRELFESLLDSLERKHGTETTTAKMRIVEDILERLVGADKIRCELLIRRTANRFGITERPLWEKLERLTGQAPAPPAPQAVPAREAAARSLLACFVASPEAATLARTSIVPASYPTEALRKIAKAAYALFDRHGKAEPRALHEAFLDGELSQAVADMLAVEVSPEAAQARAMKCLKELRRVVLPARAPAGGGRNVKLKPVLERRKKA